MILHWPQVAMLFIFATDFALAIAQHGKPCTGTHNLGASIFAIVLTASILYFGGFWQGVPQ